ncbi:hypothetical protein JYU19_02240, partial [bacterium AH-315-J21]|nr:hypothetical protein [bacterium AH-315-J21]
SSSVEQAATTTAPVKTPIDSPSEGQPKVDTIPIVELLSGFDSFLQQGSEKIDGIVFLVKKYDPGLCYGMPSPVPDEIVNGALARSPLLVEFIRNTFSVESDFQIFTKIRQLLVIKLRQTGAGAYEYYLIDGRCCDILRFHGELRLREGVFMDALLDRNIENVPC